MMGGKHHTSGGQGGMVITHNENYYWDAKRFADRGKPFNAAERKNLFLGLNYRMTELEAVIGRVQLGKLDDVIARRRSLAAHLDALLAETPAVRLGAVIPGAEPVYWLVLLRVFPERLTVSKEQFARAVAAEGLPVDPHYDWILYETPWFRERVTYGKSQCPWSCPYYGREVVYEGTCPNARRGVDAHMVVYWHEGYSEQDVEDIAGALAKVARAYVR
jgi:dTDP-4-amino-4,6-dideoxygalactose transaminase